MKRHENGLWELTEGQVYFLQELNGLNHDLNAPTLVPSQKKRKSVSKHIMVDGVPVQIRVFRPEKKEEQPGVIEVGLPADLIQELEESELI